MTSTRKLKKILAVAASGHTDNCSCSHEWLSHTTAPRARNKKGFAWCAVCRDWCSTANRPKIYK